MILSVDVGYSSVKAVSSTGYQLQFPSVVAPYRDNPINGAAPFQSGHYLVQLGKEKKFVGEMAIKSLNSVSTMQREKPAELHDLFVLTAAYLCGAGAAIPTQSQAVTLALGLPLAYYRTQREELKSRLQRLGAQVQVDRDPQKYISFQDIRVFPQGLGILFCIPSLPQQGYAGLVDIGCYTTDYMLFEIKDGEPVPVPDGCGSIEAGTYLVQQDLAAGFQSQTGAPLAHFMYQNALQCAQNNQAIRFQGREINLSQIYRCSVRETAQVIIEGVRSAWVSRAEYLSMTAFAGGGAEMFNSHLDAFPDSIIVPNPVFANANGFLSLLAD